MSTNLQISTWYSSDCWSHNWTKQNISMRAINVELEPMFYQIYQHPRVLYFNNNCLSTDKIYKILTWRRKTMVENEVMKKLRWQLPRTILTSMLYVFFGHITLLQVHIFLHPWLSNVWSSVLTWISIIWSFV